MTEPRCPPVPDWVYKRDGRLVSFEADKISRALFATTESLGRPDAFAARELTDGILHFLSAEATASVLTTAQVAEFVVKIVRELGQPAIAQAFTDGARAKVSGPPRAAVSRPTGAPAFTAAELQAAPNSLGLACRAGATALRDFSLREVFARDLAAAHAEGLLTLTGLEAPLELSGWLLGPPARTTLVESVEAARAIGGEVLAIDGPEHVIARGLSVRLAAEYISELSVGVRAAGVVAIVNLNSAAPPSWAGELAEGPLFDARSRAETVPPPANLVDELLELLLAGPADGRLQVHWHLGEADFSPTGRGRLHRIARRARDGAALAFTFDRARAPLALAEGIDRRNPAVLLTVGMHLARLAAQLGLGDSSAGAGRDPDLFLQKLGSLARMALSAAAQKRDFLRRQGRDWPAFLIDRARLVVAPVGLEWVTRKLTGMGIAAGGAGLEFARQLVQQLEAVLRRDGRAHRLDTCLAAPLGLPLEPFSVRPREPREQPPPPARMPAADRAAGVTPWDGAVPLKQQLKTAGLLHAAGGRGGVALLIDAEHPPTTDEVVELLSRAWRQTEIPRLRLVRSVAEQHQLSAPWEHPGNV